MTEEWKIYTFKGLEYKVSNTGKIIGLGRNKELKQRKNRDGYLEVTIGSGKDRTTKRVHRIVALLFVENLDLKNNIEVNHKDLKRDNNIYTNLEWVSHVDNVTYSKNLGSYKGRFGTENPNYGNTTLKEKYRSNPQLAKENNARNGAQNGRAKRVALYNKENKFIKEFSYIGECCEYIKQKLNLTTQIDAIRNNLVQRSKNNKNYRGYYIIFI